jgi:hypothetical protein
VWLRTTAESTGAALAGDLERARVESHQLLGEVDRQPMATPTNRRLQKPVPEVRILPGAQYLCWLSDVFGSLVRVRAEFVQI